MDWKLFHAVNRLQTNTAWAHGAVRLYAGRGVGIFAVLLLAGWWIGRRRRPGVLAGAMSAGLASFLALGANQLIGHAVSRARPYATHPGVHLLVARTADFSFPSDHAAVAGAVAAGLVLVERRLGLVAVGAAVVMAFSRVYVGAHYPGDVLAGLAVGAVAALLLHWPAQRLLGPVIARISSTPLAVLVRA